MTDLDLTMARQISAAAEALGVSADPENTRTWEFALDALDAIGERDGDFLLLDARQFCLDSNAVPFPQMSSLGTMTLAWSARNTCGNLGKQCSKRSNMRSISPRRAEKMSRGRETAVSEGFAMIDPNHGMIVC